MAGINARLYSEFETIFLLASENQQFVASRFVKEIHSLGGDVSYNVNAYLIVDNIELSGNTTDISFNTPAWPKPKNIDISRNVGQGPSGEEGYAILRGQVLDLGFGTENVGGANDVNLGFYIHDNI